jgi:flagellar motor switch protein FliM
VEPILKKQEISDLLAAIRAGKVSLDLEDDHRQHEFLDSKPLNLFDIAHRSITDTRIPNLDIIIDSFSRNYGIALTNKLQRSFSLQRTGLETYTFQEFLAKRKNPGAIGVLNLQALVHSALMIFDSRLSFSMIEIMLGASADIDPLQLDRELTTIELTILKTAMVEACANLNKAFKPLIDLQSSLLKVEKNVRLVSIVEPESEVLVATFTLKMDELAGEVDLLFPVAALDPLRDKLRDLLSVNITTQDSWKDLLRDEVMKTAATIVAQSGVVTLSIDAILRLKNGDIIPLDYDPNSPLKILVEDQLKFFARPGTTNGKKAISITGVYR